ncbi:Asp-tRNA(Asn)/Glu-tRNA(Gln) amidotransferase subunit GatC [Nitrococcus mobilis]|uniref:Aspartyl/glutamyl-tRNA(Asn/Gln) amidotransferase subunit C n=1 Tax=Nitrococcus mobilis Nb-231 TaxID=314278 RepID=A4BLX7_9GAMM|nr:Asp-tRNA(Asn)/Glu-tRNA(Gln) amidotransferase subunit GatC [Nitrococcus mobilis]EAR23315.1 glutamyl-tRNA(Gln) amidotransferase, C subunit [Nitrococcus mobilis Nb-231]
MSLGPSQVREIAHLARLTIDGNDIPAYAENLSRILDFVDQLGSAATEGTAPLAHPLEMPQRLRADAVDEEDQRELFQSIAPATQDGLYLVPKVIE